MASHEIFDWIEKNADKILFRTSSVAALVSAVILAFKDKTASASVMAGLFALSVLFSNLKNIEELKAWGIEAKLIKETLKEAQASLEQLKRLTVVSSRQTFYALGTIGRWSSPSIKTKNDLAKATRELMEEIGVAQDLIDQSAAPYLSSICVDLSQLVQSCIALLAQRKMQLLTDRGNELRRLYTNIDAEGKEELLQIDEKNKVLSGLTSTAAIELSSGEALITFASNPRFRQEFGNQNAERLTLVAKRIASLLDDSLKLGYFTEDARRLYEAHPTGMDLMEGSELVPLPASTAMIS